MAFIGKSKATSASAAPFLHLQALSRHSPDQNQASEELKRHFFLISGPPLYAKKSPQEHSEKKAQETGTQRMDKADD